MSSKEVRAAVLNWWALHPQATAGDVLAHLTGPGADMLQDDPLPKRGTIRQWKSRYGLPRVPNPEMLDHPLPPPEAEEYRVRDPTERGRRGQFDDPWRHDRIIKATRLGAKRSIQAKAGGISERQLNNWLRMGEMADAHDAYREFASRMREAESKCVQSLLGMIHRAAAGIAPTKMNPKGIPGDWRAAAWILERQYGYSAKTDIDLVVSGSLDASGTITVQSPEQLQVERLKRIQQLQEVRSQRLRLIEGGAGTVAEDEE